MNTKPRPNPLSAEFGEHLVTLSDGRSGLRKGLHVESRATAPADPNASQRATIDFIASSEALDRQDEIIVAAGWKLDNYRRNPVFQNAHQYGDVIFTLGRALITEVREGRLFQRVEFAVEANPMARIAYGLYRGKFLNAVSVGFIPLRWENGGAGAGYRRKHLEQELLEVSAVGLPANPEALQLGLKAGAVNKDDLRELLDTLGRLLSSTAPPFTSAPVGTLSTASPIFTPEHAGEGAGAPNQFCSPPAGAATDTRALGADANVAQWLQLARALRAILRRN